MLNLLTDFVSSPRGKWVTLALWVVLAGALISQLPRLDEVTENEAALFLPSDAESTRAFELARERFPASGTPALVVVSEPGGLGAATWAAVAGLEAWLSGPEAPVNVTRVRAPGPAEGAGSGLVSADGTTLYLFVDLAGEPAEPAFRDSVTALRERARALDLPGVEVAVGGPGGLIVDLVEVFSSINSFLLIVTVLLVLALLIAIYRSPIVALVPLLAVGLVFQLAGAVGAFVAEQLDLPVSGQTTGIMTVVLFGTGTDYVLFVSARFREELARHRDRHEAMRRTMRGVGGAVASAGATILIASAALAFAVLRSYQSLGPVIAIAVGLMMLAALTLVPAALTVLGRRAYWPLQPRFDPSAAADEAAGRENWRRSIYGRIGGVVLRRPRAALALTTAALALLIAGLSAFQTNYDQLASLPANTESVESFELLRGGFPGGELSPTRVYVSLPAGEQALSAERLSQLDELTLALAGPPAVAGVSRPGRPPRAARAAVGRPAGWVGGDSAEAADTREAGDRDSRVVLPLILLAIGVVLAVLLRSVVAPLYLMATIAFTYFATLGLAVVVFVVIAGHAGLGPGVPFFLFVFLNALSVDYNIYLMSRIREEARSRPLAEATGYALARTGPVITSAGLILAGTFSALMTLPLQDLLQLGFAVATGVLMDTFITRTLIVPALVSIVGRWNWWPSRLGPRAA